MAFFFKRVIKSFDKVAESTRVLDLRLSMIEVKLIALASLSDEFREVKQDVKKALIAAEKIKGLEDQIAVLSRDQHSIWRKIDEIKGELYGRPSSTTSGRNRV